MIPALIFILALIIGIYFIAKWWVQADPKQLILALRWAGILLAAILAIAIFLSGRWHWLPGLFFFLLPWFLRARTFQTMRKNARGPTAGQSSHISTKYLNMTLDHDSGEMTGQIVNGMFSGKNVSDLDLPKLIDFWRECAEDDEQSRVVLENYLDRDFPNWRELAGIGPRHEQSYTSSDSPWAGASMSLSEAREILNINDNASESDIEKAYRKAMKRAHPDQGGSDWMAAKVNQAKDILLSK